MNETNFSIPHKIIGVAVIWNDQKQILIDRRLPQGTMGGLWEFPGGKIEIGETIQECIKREISEELGIEIVVGEHLITIDHTYPHLRVTLTVHHSRHLAGVPQAIECDEIRWVSLDELDNFNFPEANEEIITALRKYDQENLSENAVIPYPSTGLGVFILRGKEEKKSDLSLIAVVRSMIEN